MSSIHSRDKQWDYILLLSLDISDMVDQLNSLLKEMKETEQSNRKISPCQRRSTNRNRIQMALAKILSSLLNVALDQFKFTASASQIRRSSETVEEADSRYQCWIVNRDPAGPRSDRVTKRIDGAGLNRDYSVACTNDV